MGTPQFIKNFIKASREASAAHQADFVSKREALIKDFEENEAVIASLYVEHGEILREIDKRNGHRRDDQGRLLSRRERRAVRAEDRSSDPCASAGFPVTS